MNYKELGLRESDWNQITTVISKFSEIVGLKIFGSRAKRSFKKGSDIDIALFGKDVNPEIVSKVSSQLNENTTIPFFVDVVDYTHLEKPELKHHIDEFGVELDAVLG